MTQPTPDHAPPADFAPQDETHRQMVHWLGNLDALVVRLEAEGWTPWARDTARSVVDFFSQAGRQHHADEEKLVFPLLVGRGNAELDAQVERLQQDHGWIEENWLELMSQLRPVAEGFTTYDADLLRQVSDVFTALLREHIELEETSVYPAARATLAQHRAGVAHRTGGGQPVNPALAPEPFMPR